jgi:hypothetical protein
MNLHEYFSSVSGTGVLSTSNDKGEVDSAIYAVPHVIDSHNIQFIMRNRLSRSNLKTNDKACYLFIEKSNGFKGVRLYLRMTGEEQNKEKIKAMSRRPSKGNDDCGERFLVSFSVEKALTLIGGNEVELS